ncbi:hypothetical protein [Lysobacter gummosus]|uniref:hypothetical protein n=1 Tax=Lysobacter gummosus TaxID=262324 RepID=UPI003634EE94
MATWGVAPQRILRPRGSLPRAATVRASSSTSVPAAPDACMRSPRCRTWAGPCAARPTRAPRCGNCSPARACRMRC